MLRLVVIVLISRSREGAWIEMSWVKYTLLFNFVTPARERGLKFYTAADVMQPVMSLPRGSVD